MKILETDKLVLREIEDHDEGVYRRFVQEFVDVGEKIAPGATEMDLPDFIQWIEKKKDNSRGVNLNHGHVPSTIYFLFRKDNNKIVGAIDLRHELNDALLRTGGNIGYGVVPSARRQGYATIMLKAGLGFFSKKGVKKVLITCNATNEGSRRTILKCGGFLENSVTTEDGKDRERYWIETDQDE